MPFSIGFGRAAGLILLGLAMFSTACGVKESRLPESGATLTGTIKHGDEDVQYAMVLVQTANGSATGKIGEDGKYKVENVPLGEVMIGVNTEAARGEYQSKIMGAGVYKGPEAKGKGRVNLKFVAVPAKYHNPESSGFKTTVNKGMNTFDIVIPK